MIHLDQEALGPDGAWTGTLEDGTRVSAETLRRVACDCGLVAVCHDGEALNIGRRSRSIPPAIRRALMLRDRGCAFPGCTHGRFLHAHHIEHWLHGGNTSLENLVMLCTFHHHLVHEGGWTITAVADGERVFSSPAGRPLPLEPPREHVDNGLNGCASGQRIESSPSVPTSTCRSGTARTPTTAWPSSSWPRGDRLRAGEAGGGGGSGYAITRSVRT